MPYDYSPQQISEWAAGGGKDAGRKATSEQFAQRAAQGDPAALQELRYLAGVDDNPATSAVEGWGSGDAKNYARMLLGQVPGSGYTPQYGEHQDGSDIWGKVGSVLKVAAPIAGALIPGVGFAGGALIGGLGSAAGGALHGDQFNLGKTLMAGAAGGFGNKLLGNGLGGGSSSWGFGSSGIPGAPNTAGLNPAGGAPGAPGAAGAIPGQSTGGLLGRFGDVGSLIQKYGPLALGGLGMLNQASQQSAADDTRNRALDMAQQDYASRAPLRSAAVGALTAPLKPRVDLGPGFGGPPVHLGAGFGGPPPNTGRTFADPTDPYRRN